jgi:hypothetical protein
MQDCWAQPCTAVLLTYLIVWTNSNVQYLERMCIQARTCSYVSGLIASSPNMLFSCLEGKQETRAQ